MNFVPNDRSLIAFGDAYRGRRVLVTGHTGFKGSWLVAWLRRLGAQVVGVALPPDTEPSHHALLAASGDDFLVDIRDAGALRQAVVGSEPEIVFHLAAQPLVRRSYREPGLTFETNVQGTVNLFEAVRSTPSVRAVVIVTTDKCYEPTGSVWGLREDDRLGGHDPYSASKACAEIVVASYRAGLLSGEAGRGRPVLIASARAGNVIGGGDWAEDRLVPDLVRGALARRSVAIRHPGAIRPWQHVLEPLSGYLLLGQRLLAGDHHAAQAWNFGPSAEDAWPVREVVREIARHWPAVEARAVVDADQPAETGVLRLDCAKARLSLGWRPVWSLSRAIERTARWYRDFHEHGLLSTAADLDTYLADAASARVAWLAQPAERTSDVLEVA